MKKTISAIVILFSLLYLFSCNQKSQYQQIMGFTQGTNYHITYESDEMLKHDIDSVLAQFDTSLSTYNSDSRITAINENRGNGEKDEKLLKVIQASMQICAETDGAFDITIGPIANAWGFGFKHQENVTKERIEELLNYVGCGKVWIDCEEVKKADSAVVLNVNAIAQGYSVDVVADFLEAKGIQNYMVEIGGEIKVKGKNPQKELWHVGVNKPIEDSLQTNNEIQEILKITDMSLATSGNYRKFYVKDGLKYSHTLDPKTGYPVRHQLLSASVLTESCMYADAYATSFMVMGLDRSMKFLEKHPEIQAYFISSTETGEYLISYTTGIEQLLAFGK